jgi:hypothetical protein
MVSFNAGFPDVFGLEWFVNHDYKSRIWAGSPAPFFRLPTTTVTETISGLRMSAALDPNTRASVPTLIDVFEEGNEQPPVFELARLAAAGDGAVNSWRTQAGASTNLFQSIDGAADQWPDDAVAAEWVQTTTPFDDYTFSVAATDFHVGGPLVGSRIGWVAIEAIFSMSPAGFRKLRCGLNIGGVDYQPAGGNLRDVHSYGQIYGLWYGEMNPATGLPWKPADIAAFRPGGTSFIKVRSQSANADAFPRVHAVRLNVHWTTETRVAVGVYSRPINIGSTRLQNVTTQSLITMPAGTANWAKATAKNYVFCWRQSVSPSIYGPSVADDVRWNAGFQDLGPDGKPEGRVFPLHYNDDAPAPTGKMASMAIALDNFGRPQTAFSAAGIAGFAIAPIRSADGQPSADSQPYRMDLADLVSVVPGATYGQRMTPSSTQTYAGFRLPVIPPFAGATLTVRVHRVSDGVQIGGSFTISAADTAAASKPAGSANWRYLTGFFDSTVTLTSGIQYEVRLISALTGAGVASWIVAVPDASLAPTASFGGTTSGAVVAGVHSTSRDMALTLIRQPDPPTAVTAAISNQPITTYVSAEQPTVEHVQVSWTAPAVGLGVNFRRYEIERQADGGTWYRVANIDNSATVTWLDREAPRDSVCRYRARAVGLDGRLSTYNQSGTVTPTAPGLMVVLTSNHDPSLEVVYLYDRENSFPVLSTEGNETVRIHGADRQVVFRELEDRGVGWQTRIIVNQLTLAGKGGVHVLTPLLALIRSTDIPYVCVLDNQGSQFFGDVSVADVPQKQPAHRYEAQMTVLPTHAEPVPVDVA